MNKIKSKTLFMVTVELKRIKNDRSLDLRLSYIHICRCCQLNFFVDEMFKEPKVTQFRRQFFEHFGKFYIFFISNKNHKNSMFRLINIIYFSLSLIRPRIFHVHTE